MTVKIEMIEKKENVFLDRTDLKINIIHHNQPTPNKEEVENLIAKEFKSTPDHVLVDYIFSKTGIGESVVKAKIYKKKIEKPKVEKPEKKVEEEKPIEKKEGVSETEKTEREMKLESKQDNTKEEMGKNKNKNKKG